MNERLIVYSCHDNAKDHNATMEHLRDFATEVSTIAGNGVEIEVVDGNAHFPATRTWLRGAVSRASENGSCNSEWLRKHIRTMTPEGPAVSEMPNSISGRVVIISDRSVASSIKSARDSAGVAEHEGSFCFLVDSYENILWHEAAHLFGAYEHYCEDSHKATRECQDPDLCVMRRNPGHKFCEQTKREIRNYFAKRRVRRNRTSKQRQRH